MMMSTNESWSERRRPDLPTQRQIQYWASRGALGEERRARGSGHHQHWTDADYARLAAIAGVANDLRGLGIAGPSTELVSELWRKLVDDGRALVENGAIRIEIEPLPFVVAPNPDITQPPVRLPKRAAS